MLRQEPGRSDYHYSDVDSGNRTWPVPSLTLRQERAGDQTGRCNLSSDRSCCRFGEMCNRSDCPYYSEWFQPLGYLDSCYERLRGRQSPLVLEVTFPSVSGLR